MTRSLRRLPALALWAAAAWTVYWSVDRGRSLQRRLPDVFLGAAPLVGRDPEDGWDWRFGWGLVVAALVGAVVVVACWRGWWWHLRQRWVIVGTAVATMAFTAALALTDGRDGMLYGAQHPTEYLADLPRTPPAGRFVRTFLDRLDGYSVHVRGHPPGYVLVLKALDGIGLDGVWPVAVLSVLAAGALVVGVLLTVRSVAGDAWLRRSAPFLVVAPYALWMATSADALFTAVGALGVAAAAVGLGRRREVAVAMGVLSGVLLGWLLYLTYLGALLVLLPAALLMAALLRRERGAVWVAVGGIAGALVVVGTFWAAGFWWFAGVARTRQEYWDGTAKFREWSYFGVGNLGAALFAIGPATLLGLTRLRSRRMWLLVGSALLALVISHLSQYTKAEVERIWLLFFPWLVVAGGALCSQASRRWGSMIIAAQASCAVALQAVLVSKW